MKLLLPLTLLLALTGCQPTAAPPSFQLSSDALGQSKAFIVTGLNGAQAAMPNANAVGQSQLLQIIAALKLALQQMDIVAAQDAKSAAAYSSVVADDNQTHADLKAERTHWVGYPLRMATMWTLIIGGIVVVLIFVVFGFINGASGGAGITLEMGWVGKLLTWVGSAGTIFFHDMFVVIGKTFRVGRQVIAASKTVTLIPPAAGTQAAPIQTS